MQKPETERAASTAAKTAAQRERRRASAAEARLVCLQLVDPFCLLFSRPILCTEFRVLIILFATSWSLPSRLLLSPAVALIILLCGPNVTPNRISNSPAVALLILILHSRRIEPERAERVAAKKQAAAKAAADSR